LNFTRFGCLPQQVEFDHLEWRYQVLSSRDSIHLLETSGLEPCFITKAARSVVYIEMHKTMIKTLLFAASIGLGEATRLSDQATAELREACPEYGEYSKYPQ
jgi:hypothetical protein